jgi:deoxycytidine triphosphate deaminase
VAREVEGFSCSLPALAKGDRPVSRETSIRARGFLRHKLFAARPTPVDDDITLRRSIRLEAILKNSELALPSDDGEANERYRRYRSHDPFPDIPPALLNSADIADYVSTTGMIHPFHPERLKSASYEIALLGKWFYISADGKRVEGVLSRGDTFVLPKNSIAFVSIEPYFRIPDYIALRHNLKIDHVYKGLLVGTGPLIDPGFVGHIALPLHNLTENDYTFVGGEGIIWAEFTKLSPHRAWESKRPSAVRQGSYVNFPSEQKIAKQVDQYVRDAVGLEDIPASSSAAIAVNATRARKTARRTRMLLQGASIIGVLAVAALALTLGGQINTMSQQIADLRVQLSQLQQQTPSPTPTP